MNAPVLRRHREAWARATAQLTPWLPVMQAAQDWIAGRRRESHVLAPGAQAIANAEFNERVRAVKCAADDDCATRTIGALADVSYNDAFCHRLVTDDDIRALVLLGWRDEEVTK